MKTKHLLTAIMLPAAFAACTNEDIEGISQGAQGVEGRKLVENVTLNVGNGVESRLAYGNGYTWEAGDQIGACLMDNITTDYQDENKLWHEWFNFVNYIQTNYKFVRDAEGNWTTEAKMGEGNYFFHYPYNANLGLRDAYTFTAAEQTLEGTDNASLLKAYASNNSFVGYGKVKSGDNENEAVKIDMVPVFGATGFTLKNTGTNTYTIERIILKGSNVANSATVDPTTCDNKIQYSTSFDSQSATTFNVAQYVADPSEDYTLVADGYYDPYWADYNKVAALKDVLDYDDAADQTVEVTIKAGNSIKPQQSINLIAMVAPAELNNENQALVDIYTDKGIIKDIDLHKRYTSNDNSGATTNVLTDVALTEIGTGNKVEITFDDTSLDVPATMDVDNEADLATLIHWNANVPTEITATLKADVTITKAMYDELAKSAIKKATITGNHKVTIASDVADGALDAFTFTDVENVIVNGTQSMTKANGSPVEVAADATLNIAKDVTLGAAITNKGTLNVNANVNTAKAITNLSVMTVATGKKIDGTEAISNGEASTQTVGTITNAGTITVLSNDYGTVTNTGVIGTELAVESITRGQNTADGTIINNNGKVFIGYNMGNIYANGTSTTRVNDNSKGNIIITELDADNGNFLTVNKGNIVQEISEDANTDAIDMRANTIWLSASLKVEKKDADGNFVDVNLYEGSSLKNGAMTIVATSANARIDGNDKKLRVGALEVDADSKLVLNKVQVVVPTQTGTVTMNGAADHKATLTINSNASIQVAGNGNVAITVAETNEGQNVLDNNSSNTTITF